MGTMIEQFIEDFPSIKAYLKVSGVYETWLKGSIPPDKSRMWHNESPATHSLFNALNYDFLSRNLTWAGQHGSYGHNNVGVYSKEHFEELRDKQLEQARHIIQNSRTFQRPDAYTKSRDWTI